MNLQFIDISIQSVFDYYQKKYLTDINKIQPGNKGLEIRNCPISFAENFYSFLQNMDFEILEKYASNNKADFLILDSLNRINYEFKRATSCKDVNYQKYYIDLYKNIDSFINYNKKLFNIGNKIFYFCRSYVMGIVNITPDSFSDGGRYYDFNSAVTRVKKLLESGTDIIDIGGESTRPGAESVSEKEEMERVIPIIEEILPNYPDAIISVDTTKAKVAENALKSGAKIINDISAFSYDPEILDVVRDYNATFVLMHMKGTPQTMQKSPNYKEVVSEIFDFLQNKIIFAKEKGVHNLIIDPGIGFGKRVEDNYEIIKRLNEFKSLGFPILIGLSRKSFIGKSLNLDINNRDYASMALDCLSINNGAVIIRTHNLELARQNKQIMNYYSQLRNSD